MIVRLELKIEFEDDPRNNGSSVSLYAVDAVYYR
jgi:hypothetical protein